MKVLFRKNYAYVAALIGLLCVALVAETVSAQEYVPLAGIPGVTSGSVNLTSYINALFLLSISVGAMIGVIKIGLGGFKYMMSEVVTSKEDARKDITGALIGLGILLSTFVVLYAINPELVNMNAFRNATPISLPTDVVTNGGGGGNAQTYERKYTTTSLEEAEQIVKSCGDSGGTSTGPTKTDGGDYRVTCSSTEQKIGEDLETTINKDDLYKNEVLPLFSGANGFRNFTEDMIKGTYTIPLKEYEAQDALTRRRVDYELGNQCPWELVRYNDGTDLRYYCVQGTRKLKGKDLLDIE